jgi:hypothetical protein
MFISCVCVVIFLFEIETDSRNLNIIFSSYLFQKITKIEFDFEFRLTCYLFIWLFIAILTIFLAWYRYGYIIIQQLSKTRK